MKIRTIVMATLSLVAFNAIAANRNAKLYIFGFAASFNDSTVYFTDIQEVDSAWVDSKTKFLYSRDNYSYQLRDYLKAKGFNHPTCITMYSQKRKDIDKKLASMKKRYMEVGKYDIKTIAAADFKYAPIIPNEDEMEKPKGEKRNGGK